MKNIKISHTYSDKALGKSQQAVLDKGKGTITINGKCGRKAYCKAVFQVSAWSAIADPENQFEKKYVNNGTAKRKFVKALDFTMIPRTVTHPIHGTTPLFIYDSQESMDQIVDHRIMAIDAVYGRMIDGS